MIEIKKAIIGEEKIITKIFNDATIDLLKRDIYQWKYPFFINEIKNEILLNNLYVVKIKNEIVASFCLKELNNDKYLWDIDVNEKNIYLYKLVIKLEWRGKGIYRKIIDFVKSYGEENKSNVFLSCYSGNIKNNEIYLNSGFEIHKIMYDVDCHESLKKFFEYKVYILKRNNLKTR